MAGVCRSRIILIFPAMATMREVRWPGGMVRLASDADRLKEHVPGKKGMAGRRRGSPGQGPGKSSLCEGDVVVRRKRAVVAQDEDWRVFVAAGYAGPRPLLSEDWRLRKRCARGETVRF